MISKQLELGMPLAIAFVTQLAAHVATLHDGRMGTIVSPLARLMHRLRALMSTERTLASMSGLVARQTQMDWRFALGTVHDRTSVLGVQLTATTRNHRASPDFGCSFILLRRVAS